MKNWKTKTAAGLLLAALVGTGWSMQALAEGSAFGKAIDDGYFWYKDRPAAKPKPKSKEEPKPEAVPAPKPYEKQEAPKTEKKAEFGSATWIRDK